MGHRDSYAPGTFCWADLGAGDVAAAKAFYAGVFGWSTVDMPMGDTGVYTMFQLGGGTVAGVYERDAADGPSAWRSYVSVDDVQPAVRRAVDAGATVVQDPVDVSQAGRMAVLHDPTGAAFACWEPRRTIGATLVNDPGAICLNQLNTSDPERAAAFYRELFGWRVERTGTDDQPYWGIYNGPGLNGGMMPLPPGGWMPPHWLVYFATADCDTTAGAVARAGGRVVVPPMEVPNGRIAVALDPEGAVFGLYAGNLDP